MPSDARPAAETWDGRESSPRSWTLLAAVLAAGATWLAGSGGLSSDPLRYGWDWQPALALAQPWRALTAAFVHWSAGHLLANLAGLALLALLGARAGCGRIETLAWALAWPLTHVALLLQPALAHYGGLSGVLHAGVAVVGLRLLRDRPARVGRGRWIGRAMLLGLAVKLVLEQPWGAPMRHWPGWDIPIAPLAHATGAAAGLLCALAVARVARDWRRNGWGGA